VLSGVAAAGDRPVERGRDVSSVIYINGRYLTQAITGVQRYAHELIATFDRLLAEDRTLADKYRFVILVPRRGVIHHPKLDHIEIRPVGRFTGHIWEQLDLPGASTDGALFCPGNTAPVISLILGRKTVVTVHDLGYIYFPDTYSRAFRILYKTLIPIVLRRASAVIAVSNSEGQAIRRVYGVPEARVTPIQNGGLSGDMLYDGPDLSLEEPEAFAFYVGAISKKKNVHGVIQAAAVLADEPIHFVIAGGGGKPFKDFDLPPEVERKARVELTGRISDEKLFDYLRRALCLVFPSFYEASPLPPIEAMAWGCPVVTSRIPALEERCGDAALFCDPNDPADIARQVQKLLHDPALRAELRRKGFEQARRFSWRNCALRTIAVTESVLEGRR
jgi:glycosyltransferase involved in cell wall biosynthesis